MKYVNLRSREGRQTFYNSKEWKSVRQIVLTLNPWCQECERNGRHYVLATEVHHIVDIVDEPTRCMDMENLEGLCKSCHSRLTIKENNNWKPVKLVDNQKKWKFAENGDNSGPKPIH